MRSDFPGVRRSIRRSGLSSAWLKSLVLLGSIVILFVLLPWLVPSMREGTTTVLYTAIGCSLAAIVGAYLLRNVRNYPGVEESFYIVPAFCAAYAALVVVLVFARIPYSRLLLTTAFVANVSLSILLYVVLKRRLRMRIGVVAAGDYEQVPEVPGVAWQLLRDPTASTDGLDAVSVDLWCDLSDDWERALASFALSGVPVYHSKHLRESLTGKVEIERLSENNFGTLSPLYAYMSVKKVVDWLVALVAAVVLSPILLVTGLLVRLDSPGPALFRQTRIGYQGRPFRVIKFRTMTAAPVRAADPTGRDAAMTKDKDARVTRIGRFLRQTRLDELPQLFNILAGQMSWIGPRPEAQILSRWYESEIPFYRYRHIVRPGITGWAQVHQGHVSDVAQVREKLNYDFYYIKNFSLWIDIIVVARTIRTVLTGFGSK